jgi:hypothetical protein
VPRCPVKAKGARSKAQRQGQGQAREDYVLKTVYSPALTHLGEQGASLILMAKSQQKTGERPPRLQAVARGDLGADQPARPRRRAPPTRLSLLCPAVEPSTTARRVPQPAAAPGAHAARSTVGPLRSRHVLLRSHDSNRRLAAVSRFL